MKKTLIAILTCTFLAGCASQSTSPDNRMFTKEHGVYWHADPQKSVALNAYSLAGVQVNVEEAEKASGGVDEGLASKMLLNTATGAITGGLKAGIGMFTASLYSEADAEYIQVMQYVVFVPNDKNLPIDDESLVKAGAKTIIEALKNKPQIGEASYTPQIQALDNCKISKAIIGMWDSCETSTHISGSGSNKLRFFDFQVIRPATGDELTQLGLKKRSYSVIRYIDFFPIGLEFDTTNFPGFILMPQTPKTAPGFASVSINGGEYYFIKGRLGYKKFPLKKAVN
ncbi:MULTISPECIES: hypothetical protein [Klebsiella/Raoultella group]|jgi:hypothetical protein|uniref:Uncharacterized protein n=2 Tax=Klebsiella TaxID=570 RepID=A0A6G6APD4_KLEPN|nr:MULTISPECIES: hypothetical protein [Klebsiella/Raoultella group]MBK0678640.1 hypothetical protein [Klebsiella oxytoca]MBN7912760.1 hypothetical protein [Klebsiella pneumoniae]MBN8064687.1 hypothetical protein [Klebsiella pneumoniae]MBZ7756773.1 hypothetical protein [Raoultella ornithinolytica]MCA5535174.1 hypothetical protein [Klebsiella pneumoniae]